MQDCKKDGEVKKHDRARKTKQMHFTMSYCATVHHDPAVAPGPFLLSRAGQEPLIGYCPGERCQTSVMDTEPRSSTKYPD